MDVSAVALVIAQWVHTLAAAFWVGGGLVYVLVIRPLTRQAGSGGQTLADEFRGLVDIAVIAMVITGVVLAFERLTSQHTGVGYAAVLGAKLALTLWMFWLAGVIRRRRPPPSLDTSNLCRSPIRVAPHHGLGQPGRDHWRRGLPAIHRDAGAV